MTPEYGLGTREGETAGSGGEGVDEIEMELPEGTDGPAGFRTRRKIKTRPNGCEGKFYSARHCQTMPGRTATDFGASEWFPYEPGR